MTPTCMRIARALLWMALCTSLLSANAAGVESHESRQLVMVLIADWSSTQGTLRRYELRDDRWVAVATPEPVSIGKAGAAWGVGLHAVQSGPQKMEGDGRSPAGRFAIGPAFGSEGDLRSGLAYQLMTQHDYCIDDTDSPLYNRIVDERRVGKAAVEKSTEPMRRDIHLSGDERYRIGFVIEHNAGQQKNRGSCIFGHLWQRPGQVTAGCTAMSEALMRDLLKWLDARRQPQFVLLPMDEYVRLRTAWQLPEDAAVGSAARH